ncbi:MAG TPA: UDP-2,3-diacylglucosamine diphosphatase LpxI, partial [Candidatus Binatia bacterium]|nr:UDP-2,3-diacylglucosamine diphosphatase LpxI [Candidatus Binatia bacterium]
TGLGGPGAVIVKAPAPAHDYRVDTPLVGSETVAAAVAGSAAVLAFEAGRVAVLDRPACIAAADAAGLTLLGVE